MNRKPMHVMGIGYDTLLGWLRTLADLPETADISAVVSTSQDVANRTFDVYVIADVGDESGAWAWRRVGDNGEDA